MSKAGTRPHIVWIMADQLRWDAMGFMGCAIARTPNLDRLAASGVVLEQMHTVSSVCMPSRGAMITGRYPRNIGMAGGSALLHPREETLPEILQGHDYRTGLFGKLHITPQQYTRETLQTDTSPTDAAPYAEAAGVAVDASKPARRHFGFQYVSSHEDALQGPYRQWLAERAPGAEPGITPEFPDSSLRDVGLRSIPAELHPSTFIASEASAWFAANHAAAPLYMQVSFVDPHHPFDPPPEIAAHYPPEEMPLPTHRDPGDVVWPPQLAERAADFSQVSDHVARTTIAYYHAMNETFDRALGGLIETIEAAGQMENTVFAFVADHGELLGHAGLWRKGSYHYDCITRVPSFVAAPGRMPGGRRDPGLVQTIDLTTTLMGLAGLEPTPGMQGRDHSAALLAGQPIEARPWVWTELYTAFWGPFVAVWTLRTTTAKLNYFHEDRVGHLFDLVADPDEQHDLWNSPAHRNLRDEMMANLLEEIGRQADPLPLRLTQY